jgi:hypothetical protein
MRFLICCAALVFTTVVRAQSVSAEMESDTRAFLELTGALKIGEQMGNAISQQIISAVKQQNPGFPAGASDVISEVVRENVTDFVNSPEAIEGLIAIYAKYYTHDDILALTGFYRTPLGSKMITIGPQIAQESSLFGQSLFLQRVPQMQKDIIERLRAAGLIPAPPAQPAAQ